eukprot:CAMPEP_0175811136 /NCGR_PEP_ID=MMETSP0107_2-20121207/3690_1 /TAXON_ID=195067 ORGANISM="Goniomonas pacifica, Strain CCMP1869" /NCGR_SAMPLE_ID=MMETSP0107_2 /ASSEMBLY_ACC=CAM_ASM_000203 /LENGTH=118 /DNA_ID=CAMNT_0017122927 /DNA_START=155 /DNA_END=511 /DNA_ORIENTATION=-
MLRFVVVSPATAAAAAHTPKTVFRVSFPGEVPPDAPLNTTRVRNYLSHSPVAAVGPVLSAELLINAPVLVHGAAFENGKTVLVPPFSEHDGDVRRLSSLSMFHGNYNRLFLLSHFVGP